MLFLESSCHFLLKNYNKSNNKKDYIMLIVDMNPRTLSRKINECNLNKWGTHNYL
jgi:hypothetical protein